MPPRCSLVELAVCLLVALELSDRLGAIATAALRLVDFELGNQLGATGTTSQLAPGRACLPSTSSSSAAVPRDRRRGLPQACSSMTKRVRSGLVSPPASAVAGVRCSDKTGAITFVQRFGGLVNLNVHFHLLVPDGVFTETDAGLAFVLLPPPTGRELLAILDRVIRRVAQRLAREQPDDAIRSSPRSRSTTCSATRGSSPRSRPTRGSSSARPSSTASPRTSCATTAPGST
jgi:hypothetical protein